MHVKPTTRQAILGITGHVGAGHVHSNFGFIQDDSAGFTAVCSLIKLAYPVDTEIRDVTVDGDTVEVRTVGGGIGNASARRGITPDEADLLQRAIGLDGLFSQTLAFRCLGRVYGQGVTETPVALQTAVCLAVIDTFFRNYPDGIWVSEEGPDGNVGKCMGTRLDVDGIDIAVLAVLNATAGGLGPVEDLEGNINLADKGHLMAQLGLNAVPTIVLEGKAYAPSVSRSLQHDSFWVRYNQEMDNPAVGQSLIKAVQTSGLPLVQSHTAYPRNTGDMKAAKEALGNRIVEIGTALRNTQTAFQKMQLVGELAVLVSQDAGGVTFMTDSLHEVVAGGGLVPGTAAMLSMVVSQATIDQYHVPKLLPQDVDHYLQIAAIALTDLHSNLSEAQSFLERSHPFPQAELERLIRKTGERQG